jgi:MFS family permease
MGSQGNVRYGFFNDRATSFTAADARLVLLLYALCIVDGIDMQLPGVTIAAISSDWGMPLSRFGMIMASGHAGSALGAIMGGVLGDRLGRRRAILMNTFLFGIFTLLATLADGVLVFSSLRLVAGIGLGAALPPALALMSETVAPRLQGMLVSLALLCAPFGIAVAGFLSACFLDDWGWQGLFLLAGGLTLALLGVLAAGLPESPLWRARPISDAPPPPNWRLPGWNMAWGLLLATFFVAYLAMSMVLGWLPAIMTSRGLGNALAGLTLSSWSLAGMAGVLTSGLMLLRVSAPRLIIGYMIMTLLFAIALSIAFHSRQPVIILGFAALCGFAFNGVMSLLNVVATTRFPPAIRSTGVGITIMAGRMGAISGAMLGAQLVTLFDASAFFICVAVMVAVALCLKLAQMSADRARPQAGETVLSRGGRP